MTHFLSGEARAPRAARASIRLRLPSAATTFTSGLDSPISDRLQVFNGNPLRFADLRELLLISGFAGLIPFLQVPLIVSDRSRKTAAA